MFWDIFIALAVGITQLATTAYGVWVSVIEHRVRNAIIVGLVGAVGIGFTVAGTVRNSALQEELIKNTQPHAAIKIEPKGNDEALPEPLTEGGRLRLNYMYLNIGN